LLVPADVVPDVVATCVQRGVGAVVIMSAGFAEDSRGEGGARQRRLLDAMNGSDLVVLGPNSEGYLDLCTGVALSFSSSVEHVWRTRHQEASGPSSSPAGALLGGVAVVAQSGGLGFAVFSRGVDRGVRFSHVISVGNELNLDALECADYLLTR